MTFNSIFSPVKASFFFLAQSKSINEIILIRLFIRFHYFFIIMENKSNENQITKKNSISISSSRFSDWVNLDFLIFHLEILNLGLYNNSNYL